MKKQRKASNVVITVFLSLLSLVYLYPIFMILMNSLKTERAITTSAAFQLPTAETFAGLENYVSAIISQGFLQSLGYSLFITISSVALILVCCSMCAWYITRVKGRLSRGLYFLFVLSMVVPFQMVMFTLSQTADRFRVSFFGLFDLRLNTPWTICIIYLGFGAGLAVFMFTGFVKSMPIAIEEAAMIDGCNPIQIFFKVVCPILKPTMISTAILETMWVWNDYLLPTLVLDIKTFRTIPMAIQYFRGSYGKVEMAPMMACIMITVLPVIVLYLICQKYIIDGVVAGAVKG
ncbi:MAG: carbohydrate ABC transporter permease [Gemmiger sp.]|uniref:carbohydrate ABC transporter permease n=1 Tax=Gemmiger sp. TaxID=2049027 RepID=UPI00284DFB4E|nr:carbohydrate ABC transporter permease [Gemmiger sp.]MDR4067641.1 carbohydrate ABC transporter permease [Gemmiger sp.]